LQEFVVYSEAETFIRVVWITLVLGARPGGGSSAPSLGGSKVDGSSVPLGSTATHEPTG